jgi:hypothetical protein
MTGRSNKIKIFEAYVLRALSIQYVVIGILYLVQKDWWVGFTVVLLSFLFGFIGQGLPRNRGRNSDDLAKGQDWEIIEPGEADIMTVEESNVIGKAFVFLIPIVAITALVLLIHANLRWYFAAFLSVLVGTFYPVLMLFFGIYWVRFTNRG